jgi:hypothetical protein
LNQTLVDFTVVQHLICQNNQTAILCRFNGAAALIIVTMCGLANGGGGLLDFNSTREIIKIQKKLNINSFRCYGFVA